MEPESEPGFKRMDGYLLIWHPQDSMVCHDVEIVIQMECCPFPIPSMGLVYLPT